MKIEGTQQLVFDLDVLMKFDIQKEEKKADIKKVYVKNKIKTFSDDSEPINNNALKAYIDDMKSNDIVCNILSMEEEREYFEKIKSGDLNAKQDFIKHNLRLVVSVSKKFFSKNDKNSFTEVDIIQEGNLGLINAIDKYDPSKGTKFSTYAVFWIEQSIRRAFENKGRLIRIPNYRISQLSKINKFSKEYEKQFNREPSIKEISEKTKIKEFSIAKALSYNNPMVSLNNSSEEDGTSELINNMKSDMNVEESILNKEMKREIQQVLQILSKEEKEIILLKFFKNYKISEIESKLRISHAEVKSNIQSALKKMRKAMAV